MKPCGVCVGPDLYILTNPSSQKTPEPHGDYSMTPSGPDAWALPPPYPLPLPCTKGMGSKSLTTEKHVFTICERMNKRFRVTLSYDRTVISEEKGFQRSYILLKMDNTHLHKTLQDLSCTCETNKMGL